MSSKKPDPVRKYPPPVTPNPDVPVQAAPVAPLQGHQTPAQENQPSINYPDAVTQANQPEAERLKREAEYRKVYPGTRPQKPQLTPAQAEYKRVYPNTVFPEEVAANSAYQKELAEYQAGRQVLSRPTKAEPVRKAKEA